MDSSLPQQPNRASFGNTACLDLASLGVFDLRVYPRMSSAASHAARFRDGGEHGVVVVPARVHPGRSSGRYRYRPQNLQSASTSDFDQQYKTVLSRVLSSTQIYFMVTSSVVGVGFFQNLSYALRVAGPGGALLGVFIVGVIVVAVMECVGEMIIMFPTPNAMVEFVHTFMDEDFAVIIGVGYWFTHCVSFASLVTSAVNLFSYWSLGSTSRSLLSAGILLGVFGVNLVKVQTFALIESAFGIMKMLVVATLITIQAKASAQIDSKGTLDQGITSDGVIATNRATAMFIAISLAVFPFIGVETIATMSFETLRPAGDLQWPVKNIGWIITVTYLILALMNGLSVPWEDAQLPQYSDQVLGGVVPYIRGGTGNSSAPVIAANLAGISGKAINGLFAFCAVGSSTMGLYAASRSLFGMARILDTSSQWLPYRVIAWFGVKEKRTRAPWRALLASFCCCCWLSFVASPSTDDDSANFKVVQTLVNFGSVNCIVMWASQCVVYIRYHSQRIKYEAELTGFLDKFRHSSKTTYLADFQPVIAWIGLTGCILLLFLFNSASLWNNKELGVKITGAYFSLFVGLASWMLVKSIRLWRRSPKAHWYVKLQTFADFKQRLLHLHDKIYPTDYSREVEFMPPPESQVEMRSFHTPPRLAGKQRPGDSERSSRLAGKAGIRSSGPAPRVAEKRNIVATAEVGPPGDLAQVPERGRAPEVRGAICVHFSELQRPPSIAVISPSGEMLPPNHLSRRSSDSSASGSSAAVEK